jgi:hypothetical protein
MARNIAFPIYNVALIFVLHSIVAFLPIVALMFVGERWRKAMGQPKEI